MASKVIISCAITGSIHTPSMSPHLAVTAEEITESAVGAAEAGAAIIHLHARNPEDGRPDQSPEAFEPFLRAIKSRSNAVLNLTTGGSPYMPVEERVQPAARWKPEVASLNMGSMNFGLFPMLKRYKEFKFKWEPEMLENSHDLVFRNSFKDIRYALAYPADENTAFPRWLGWFILWVAIAFEVGAIAFMTKTGPFAWDGIIVFWMPFTLFFVWVPLTSIMMLRALKRQRLAA